MDFQNEIKKYYRVEGNYILRDSHRVYKIDFIDSDGFSDCDKFYIVRSVRDGKYKKVSKSNIIDFTVISFLSDIDDNSFSYVINKALPDSLKNYKSIMIEDHISDFIDFRKGVIKDE